MKNKDLNCLILKIIAQKYSCAHEIMQRLKENVPDFEKRKFYPTLSKLQLENYLCTNWLKNDKGQNVKYYHITRNGHNYIYQ
jgi:DNA-binding PadR family transcriptional regulator